MLGLVAGGLDFVPTGWEFRNSQVSLVVKNPPANAGD